MVISCWPQCFIWPIHQLELRSQRAEVRNLNCSVIGYSHWIRILFVSNNWCRAMEMWICCHRGMPDVIRMDTLLHLLDPHIICDVLLLYPASLRWSSFARGTALGKTLSECICGTLSLSSDICAALCAHTQSLTSNFKVAEVQVWVVTVTMR